MKWILKTGIDEKTYEKGEKVDFSVLYKQADQALYQAKEAGRKTYRFFAN